MSNNLNKRALYMATAAFGIESVVLNELKHLGIEGAQAENGRVLFYASPEEAAKACLWLRTADRVFLVMGRFTAKTFDELFEGVRALPWEDLLPKDAIFPVDGKSVKSTLFSISDCQAITKKAIAKRMGEKYKMEWLPETGVNFPILVGLLKDEVTLSVDLCGTGLHKRGYRKLTGEAPLRETLAAALVLLARWFPDRPLFDPLCGTGTIPIEAALIGQNRAPGLNRPFACENWPLFRGVFPALREQARDAIRPDAVFSITGTDIDESVIRMARYHAQQAGVADCIHFQRMDFNDIGTRFEGGFFITNPPYGERLMDEKAAQALYRKIRNAFNQFPTWGQYIIAADKEFERHYGKTAERRRKLYNGRIECTFYQYPTKWRRQRPVKDEAGE